MVQLGQGKRCPPVGGCSPLFLSCKGAPQLHLLKKYAQPAVGMIWDKRAFFFWLGLKLDSCSQCTMEREPAGSCCGPGVFLGGVCVPWQTRHLLTSPLSQLDLHGSRALIRADEAGASSVLSAVLPTGDTYWATTVIPLSPRGLLGFEWD